MSVLDGPGEGTWSVFAAKVVEQREELIHKLADAARERDEARAQVKAWQAEVERLRALLDGYSTGDE